MLIRDYETTIIPDTTIHVVCDITPADPGRMSGPPELCYPPEPAEVEIVEAWVAGANGTRHYLDPEAVYAMIGDEAAVAEWMDQVAEEADDEMAARAAEAQADRFEWLGEAG